MVRYHRMKGDDTLWLPGVDHASIAAQFVLDRILAEEGRAAPRSAASATSSACGSSWTRRATSSANQHHRLGASVDWSRLRFTMDEGSARAVRVAFKRLWDAGLVYRGEALVNWCPRCLHHHQRPREHPSRRDRHALDHPLPPRARGRHAGPGRLDQRGDHAPETLLGDTAVAVHPDDERYRDLIGRHALLPFLGRRLPIVADEHVERTVRHRGGEDHAGPRSRRLRAGEAPRPARDHVLDEEARINDAGGEFAGLDRYEARPEILARLAAAGDLEDERRTRWSSATATAAAPWSSRGSASSGSSAPAPLAERALASVREGRTKILPAHFEKVYAHWMENIHDWAVGRQLWWGHRIPAWFCPDGHVTVSDAEAGPDACAECGRPAAELTPGDRHLRHLVQLRAVAVQHARLAR
jgi:valyl-tRNA synthetase